MAAYSTGSVSELLNFDVQEFLGDLGESVEIELVKGVEELKKELKKTALQKNMRAVTDERLEEACQALLATMRKHFSRNTGKFELYARRNIFCMPEIGKSSGAGGSGATEQADVEALKAKYSELQDDCSRLAEETNNLDSLLKEMRSALYNVRVAAQSLESKDQSNLAETVASLNNQKTALSALTRKAKELTEEIDGVPKGAAADEAGGSAAAGRVKVGGAADAAAVTASVRGGR